MLLVGTPEVRVSDNGEKTTSFLGRQTRRQPVNRRFSSRLVRQLRRLLAASKLLTTLIGVKFRAAPGFGLRVGSMRRSRGGCGDGLRRSAMIPVLVDVRVWLATGYTIANDFDGRAAGSREGGARDPHGGHLFVLRGRRGMLEDAAHRRARGHGARVKAQNVEAETRDASVW